MNWSLSTTASKQHSTLYSLQRALSTFSTRLDRRWGIKQTRSLHDGRIIHIPKADVFRFGDTKASDAIFKELEWTVKDGENWAVIGATPCSKSELFRVSGLALPQHSSCSDFVLLTIFKGSTWPATPQALSSRRDISLPTPYHQRYSGARCSPARILCATARQTDIRWKRVY